jgi:hypothetical protein
LRPDHQNPLKRVGNTLWSAGAVLQPCHTKAQALPD